MSMTKKEQAAFDDLQEQLRLAKALRWTEAVEPDIEPPTDNGLRKGFLYNDYLGGPEAVPACTGAVSHAYGRDDKTTSQRARSLYSTRLRALRGLRHAVELKVADILAAIDQQIEAEQAK